MTHAAFRVALARCRTLALVTVLTLQAAPPAFGVDTGHPGAPPRDPPLDCTNRDNNICMECGQEGGMLACCINGCDIIIGPQPPPAPIRKFPAIRKGLGSMTYFR